jgi:hypothetical protein
MEWSPCSLKKRGAHFSGSRRARSALSPVADGGAGTQGGGGGGGGGARTRGAQSALQATGGRCGPSRPNSCCGAPCAARRPGGGGPGARAAVGTAPADRFPSQLRTRMASRRPEGPGVPCSSSTSNSCGRVISADDANARLGSAGPDPACRMRSITNTDHRGMLPQRTAPL